MNRYIHYFLFLISLCHGQWQEINQPNIGTVSVIAAKDNVLYTATNQAQVFISIDQADSWEILSDTLETEPYGVDLLFMKENAIFFTQNVGSGPYNYISVEDDIGWMSWQTLPYQSSALTNMVANDSLLFTNLNGISISSDMGETWNGIPFPPVNGYVKLNLATNDYLYVSHGCQIYRTGDLGQTWEDITGILDEEGYDSPYNCSTVMAMISHGDQLIISMYWGGGLGKLFVSDDYGITWTVLNEFPLDHSVNAIESKNNIVYVGTGSTTSGVYYTTDFTNWMDFSNGLESYDRSVSQLIATDEYLYKTGSTISSHRAPLVQLYNNLDHSAPINFKLYNNYPNPFNPVTTLQYDLPQDAVINITIYDMMGRLVNTLVSSQQNAGYKLIQWNGTNNAGQPVSAGVYLYRIETGDFRQTKKMVLLK